MVLAKKKTVSKVVATAALKATARKMLGKSAVSTEETNKVAKKLFKRPAAAQDKELKKKQEAEEDSEEESEEESEVEEEAAAKGKAALKRPAAAKEQKDEESDDEEEEEEDSDEDEDEEMAESKAATGKKAMKKPASAKAADADKEEDEEDEEESEEEESEEDDDEVEAAPTKVMKKPAASSKMDVSEDESEDEEGGSEEDDEEQDEEVGGQIVAVDEKKQEEATEKELVIERTKELKSIAVSDLKELVLSNGLQTGTKDVMIKSLLKHEAKLRAAAREQKAKIRAIVVQKKQELEALSQAELTKLCKDAGLQGLKTRPEKVQRLLVQWQEKDGVDKALADIAEADRKSELSAMDNLKLRKYCNKLGVDPFVKEVMVERLSAYEQGRGVYARPTVRQPADSLQKDDKKVDMVDELLANEAQRKKEKALKDKQEAALLQKRKELKAMSVEDLKKRMAKKGLESTGKREDMVEALFIAGIQEDAAAARKTELQSKSTQDLKELLSLNGLEAGAKDQMVKTMLAHEKKVHEDLRAFDAQVDKLVDDKQKVLETKSIAHVKDLCANKGLAVKGEKNERIEHILEEARKAGEFDRVVSMQERSKRKEELMKMDKAAVLKICEKTEVDPFVKDIMVERIMAHESEAGAAIAADDEQPAAKKARVSRK